MYTADFHHWIQTLTELNLWKNQIGDEGAGYLGDAMKENQVSP